MFARSVSNQITLQNVLDGPKTINFQISPEVRCVSGVSIFFLIRDSCSCTRISTGSDVDLITIAAM